MSELIDVATIPANREGYALDPAASIVHKRWALHARGLVRVKSLNEVRAWLGPQVTVCPDPDCWVPPAAPAPAAPKLKEKRSRKDGPSQAAAVMADAIEQQAYDDAVAACPQPFWHETHRYCPVCPWNETGRPLAAIEREGDDAESTEPEA